MRRLNILTIIFALIATMVLTLLFGYPRALNAGDPAAELKDPVLKVDSCEITLRVKEGLSLKGARPVIELISVNKAKGEIKVPIELNLQTRGTPSEFSRVVMGFTSLWSEKKEITCKEREVAHHISTNANVAEGQSYWVQMAKSSLQDPKVPILPPTDPVPGYPVSKNINSVVVTTKAYTAPVKRSYIDRILNLLKRHT